MDSESPTWSGGEEKKKKYLHQNFVTHVEVKKKKSPTKIIVFHLWPRPFFVLSFCREENGVPKGLFTHTKKPSLFFISPYSTPTQETETGSLIAFCRSRSNISCSLLWLNQWTLARACLVGWNTQCLAHLLLCFLCASRCYLSFWFCVPCVPLIQTAWPFLIVVVGDRSGSIEFRAVHVRPVE